MSKIMITNEISQIDLTINSDSRISEDTFLFKREKIKLLIDPDCVVLDIGAHIGNSSLLFGSCAKKVISFEPNKITFNILKSHADNNPQLNIIPYNLACTKEDKEYIFNYTDPDINGKNSNGGYLDNLEDKKLKHIHPFQQKVTGINLYTFLLSNHIDDIDNIKFIKINSMGYDKEIIKSIIPLINKNKPNIIIQAFKSLTQKEIVDYYNTINSLGYKIYDISPLNNINDCTGPLNRDDFEYFIYNICNNGNLLCVHKDNIKNYNLPDIIPGKTCVVVFGRNDKYKENDRFIIHLEKMLETFDEVIYVDWNSPIQSFLNEVKDKLPKTNRLKHFVIVPEIAHILSGEDPNAQACSTVYSFNIGIRRTNAEYIVLSTTDIIPPNKETMQKFIKNMDKYTFYTFSRRDINYNDVIKNINNLDEYREYLNKTTEPRYFPAKVTPNDDFSLFNCCGDFQLATKNIWLKVHGYEEQMKYACFVDTNVQKKAVLYGFKLKPIYDIPLYHMSHTGMSNDGTSPSKNVYNNAMQWVEHFNTYIEHDHMLISRNEDNWGFSDIEIEYELI